MKCAAVALVALLMLLPTTSARATQTCDSSAATATVCYDFVTRPVIVLAAYLQNGLTYTIETADLQNVPGESHNVDTVLKVLRPSTGAVIVSNDDNGGSRSSKVSVVGSGEVYWIVVFAYLSATNGTTDVLVKQSGVTVHSWNDLEFGGFRLSSHEVKAGDRLFVGFPPGGLYSGILANRLLVFSSSALTCASGCGTFQNATWDAGTLSQLTSTATLPGAMVLVGAWGFDPDGYPVAAEYVSTRFFHSRLGTGWGGTPDPDSDGLSTQIEALASYDPVLNISTCESSIGPSPDCSSSSRRKFASVMPFNPADTDSDGLRDDWELYGIRMDCASTPVAPYYDVGSCTDRTFPTTTATGLLVTNALSTIDSNPSFSDYFLELQGAVGASISGTDEDRIRYTYEVEGLECVGNTSTNPTICPTDLQDFNAIHVHFDSHEGEVYAYPLAWPAPRDAWPLHAYALKNWPLSRRATGTHRLAFLRESTLDGRAWGTGRFLITPGRNNPLATTDNIARTLVHEIGHTLGISGDATQPQPNYFSIMNYSVGPTIPKKAASGNLWPSDWGSSCPCTYGTCVGASCEVTCRSDQARMSRGLNPSLREDNQAELYQDLTVTTQQRCRFPADGYNAPVPADCSIPGNCRIDWNVSGTFDAAGATNLSFDADKLNFSTNVPDINDWNTIRDQLRTGVNGTVPTTVTMFASDFDTTSATDFSGFDGATVVGTSVTTAPSISAAYGNALQFTACSSCSQSFIDVNDSPQMDAMSKTIGGVSPQGFRFDVIAKFTGFSFGSGHSVVENGLFNIRVSNASRKATLNVKNGSSTVSVTNPVIIGTNQWVYIVALWNRASHEERLYVIPMISGAFNFDVDGRCARTLLTPSGELDPGKLRFGLSITNPNQFQMTGLLDHPHLVNYFGGEDRKDLPGGNQCIWLGTGLQDVGKISCGTGTSLCGN